MKGQNVVFSSERGDWRTPAEFFSVLHREFGFKLDAAATTDNSLCKRHLKNAFTDAWKPGPVYCNPPYTDNMPEWIDRAIEQRDSTVVMLVPARTDTTWWQYGFCYADEIRFLKGRLKFDGGPHSAPFPSCVMIFRPRPIGLMGDDQSPLVRIWDWR